MLESQKILLGLVKELDEICKKHNITYYLIGGSALGAVRHHGFLPWDDDADIVMDHENYMKFVEVMSDPANIPPNRAYEDPFIAPYSQINVFGRYSATDTTCIFNMLCFTDVVHGIKVDVFHLIPCPDDGPERDEFLVKFRKWAELCHPFARNKEMDAELYRSTIEEADKIGEAALRKRLFDDLHIERYNGSSQYIYCYEKLHIFYNKDVFQEPVYFPFEDCLLPVPTKYAEHFRILFGDDWYCIPEGEERIIHLTAQDVHRGYCEYTSDYYHYASSELKELYQEYKYTVFRGWGKQREITPHQMHLRKPLVEKKMADFWERNRMLIEEEMGRGEYESVIKNVGPYLEEQLNDFTNECNMFLEVDKNLFKTAVKATIYSSQTKIARRLLELAPTEYRDGEIDALRVFLEKKDMLIDMEEAGATPEMIFEENEKLLVLHNDDRDLKLRKARLLQIIELNNSKEEIVSICKDYPDDGDFIAEMAKMNEQIGNKEIAISQYRDAIANTQNGMVILESRGALYNLTGEEETDG